MNPSLRVRQKQAETVRTQGAHRKEGWELGKVTNRPLDGRDHPPPTAPTWSSEAHSQGPREGSGWGDQPRARVSFYLHRR